MPNYSAGATGALSGAATGAAVGSVVPGIGTAVGAIGGGIIGGLGGLFSGGGDAPAPPPPNPIAQAALGDIVGNAQGRVAPSMYGSQFGVDPTGRQGILDTTGRLGRIAAGTQQGAGEMAVNAQVGRANAAQMAAARASRGANAALAFRNAQRNQMDIGLAGAGQAGVARLQDQAAANQQLGGLFTNLYGQDAGVAAQNAQLAQAAQQANLNAQLQQRQLNDAYQIQALGQMQGWSQQQIDAYRAQLQQQQIDLQKPNLMGNLLQGAGTYMQLKGMGAFNQPAAPNAPMLPNPGGLAAMYPHGGDQTGSPVTMPS
jgi:hypothetical protein